MDRLEYCGVVFMLYKVYGVGDMEIGDGVYLFVKFFFLQEVTFEEYVDGFI